MCMGEWERERETEIDEVKQGSDRYVCVWEVEEEQRKGGRVRERRLKGAKVVEGRDTYCRKPYLGHGWREGGREGGKSTRGARTPSIQMHTGTGRRGGGEGGSKGESKRETTWYVLRHVPSHHIASHYLIVLPSATRLQSLHFGAYAVGIATAL